MPLSEPMKALAAEMGRTVGTTIKAMRAEIGDELAMLRKATTEHREMRERHADDAVRAAIGKLERDLRAYLDQRIERAMNDLISDIGKVGRERR